MAKLSRDGQSALEMLKKSRLLSNLPEESLKNLVPFLKIKRYPEQTELPRENPNSAEVHFLIRGKVAIYSNGNLIYKLRRLGDMFGGMSFITDKKCHAKEITETPVELLSLNISEIIKDPENAAEEIKLVLYQLFTSMLVDKLTMCCSRADEQHAVVSKLGKLKDLLAETRLKLKASDKVKQDFLSNISHEIRTPMHGVLGMTSLLLNTELTDQQKEFAQTIQQSATAFLDVINNILDFSEIGSGELELQDRPFDINKVLEKVLKELEPDPIEGNVIVSRKVAPETPGLLKGDAVRIRQVLINLIGNAIKFTEKGEVNVLVDVVSRYEKLVRLKFSVNDTGIGISDSDKKCLFKSFSQVDTSLTRQYDGTGLGLVISKQLVEAMGGEIGFDSQKGIGSTFWFTLDLTVQQDRRIKKEPGLPQHRKPTRQSDEVPLLHPKEKRKCRVLLVSNDKIDQLIIQLMLEKLGYSTCMVNSLDSAFEHLANNEIDAALFDVNFPGIVESDCSKNSCSRKLNITDIEVPTIALTSHVMDTNRTKCLRSGMIDYIAKPISIESLDMVLQRWISIRKDEKLQGPDFQHDGNVPCVDLNVTDRLQREIGEIDSLIGLFVNEIPEKMQSIKRAISSDKCCELEHAAHTLKSNCITFGAMVMADICNKLESIGSGGTTNDAYGLFQMLEAQCQDVMNFLKSYFQIDPG